MQSDDDRAADGGGAEESAEQLDERRRIEIRRRLAEVRSGQMGTLPSEQVDREMEEIIARARLRRAGEESAARRNAH